MALGFVIPLALWVADPPDGPVLIIACVLAGEAIDRAEYYLELERETPRRRMADVMLGLAARSS